MRESLEQGSVVDAVGCLTCLGDYLVGSCLLEAPVCYDEGGLLLPRIIGGLTKAGWKELAELVWAGRFFFELEDYLARRGSVEVCASDISIDFAYSFDL